MNRRFLTFSFWGAVLVVLGIAAFLRLWKLNEYPQGFHYDEAVNLIVAREIAFQGARPFPVFAAFNGREVLYYYLSALGMIGWGSHIITMRLVSAFTNLLTVALTIGIGRAMFGGKRGVIIGIIAAGFMAISFPQIFIARQAFRAVTLPLMQALCFWLLLRGLRQDKYTIWLALAGVSGGLTLYTYMASRLWPLWLAFFMLIYIWGQQKQKMWRFQQAVVVGLFFFLTAMPILKYYIEHPDVFNDRLSQLSGGEEAPSYAESIWLHAKMFFIKGDPYIRYNDPQRPYFDPIGGGLFLIGLGVCAWYFLRTKPSLMKASYALILFSPLMIIPSILAVGGMPPSHMRSIAMIPFVFFLPSLGFVQLGTWLQHISLSHKRKLLAVAILAVFLGMSWQVQRQYEHWASLEELYYLTDGDMVAAGEWLSENSDENTLIYITSLHYDHPSLQIYDLTGENITYLLGDRFYLPPHNQSAYFVEVANAPLAPIFMPYAQRFGEPEMHYNQHGQWAFTVYAYDGTQALSSSDSSTSESIGGWLRLNKTQFSDAISGQSLTVLTFWEIIASPPYSDLTPLFQLETQEGDVLDRVEPYSARTNFWHQGETLIQSVIFDIPPATPPDTYRVRVAWVGRSTDNYIGRIDQYGRFAGIWSDVGQVKILRSAEYPNPNTLDIPIKKSADFGSVQLLGYNALSAELRPAESIKLDLYWYAETKPTHQTLKILGYDENGTEYVWWEGAPVMNRYPFTEWEAGEVVIDRHRWRVPIDLEGGKYTLWLAVDDQQLMLGDVHVANLTRIFERPNPMNELNFNFGNIVQLIGYDLPTSVIERG
ncbi:MAG: hypothetical protein CUN55_11410, partial [Phototrophicales bacterium]